MPSIITHHIFSEEVYKNLNLKIQDELSEYKIIYNTFAQSHDYLYYYFERKNKKTINELGHTAHYYHSRDYLLNIIKCIDKAKEKKELKAYLYGCITHYILDATCHPYIFYKTGVYRKKEKETYKYRGEHTRIEKIIDSIYYQEYYKKDYKNCNISKEFIKNPVFSKELENAIDYAYKKTYNIENVSYYYKKGIKDAKLLSSLIIKDKLGIKYYTFHLIDQLTKRKFGYLEGYSTHLNTDNNYDLKERKIWHHPCNNKEYTTSFKDLYEKSLKECVKLIEKIDKYFQKEISFEELTKIIPNVSYTTGLEEEKSTKMIYFI